MSPSSMVASNGRNSRRRRRQLTVLVYLAALHVAAGPLNIASAWDSAQASGLDALESPSPGGLQVFGKIEQEDAWIDAFDMRTCGDAEFKPWQEAQSAFGCAGNLLKSPDGGTLEQMSDVSSRIFGGERANEGEFPSYVHMNATIKIDKEEHDRFACGATLIDKNLVVTAAHCLTAPVKRALIFGSNWLNGSGGEVRQVGKWCYPSVFNINRTFNHDLAIIRFEEPIAYVPKKIWPACVNLNSRHLDTAKCAYAGLGHTDDFDEGSASDYLKTLTAERACPADTNDNSCYLASDDKTHGARRGDSGSPIYCYDRCDGGSRGRAQAFVVAAHSKRPGPRNNMQVADFNILKSYFLDMLKMIRLEGDESSDEIVCKVASQVG